MDSRGTLQGTTDFYFPGKIRVFLVYEAGFRDPQCQKLFVKIVLPFR